jgi:hypothetical protein
LLIFLTARHNKIGLKDAFLASFTLKKLKRTTGINLVGAAVLLVPFALVFWQLKRCDPTLFGG